MGERRVFSKEFKEQAVELALRGDRKGEDPAAELGISGNMLSRWKREMKQGRESALKVFPGRGKARDEELVRLRKEVADLRETSD